MIAFAQGWPDCGGEERKTFFDNWNILMQLSTADICADLSNSCDGITPSSPTSITINGRVEGCAPH
jgi:hypothetical protein